MSLRSVGLAGADLGKRAGPNGGPGHVTAVSLHTRCRDTALPCPHRYNVVCDISPDRILECPLSTVNCQLLYASTVKFGTNCQLSTVNCQLLYLWLVILDCKNSFLICARTGNRHSGAFFPY
ncbi:MAG: hypothetical protein JGK08_10545 [Microcoleus sp. PH2017_04_SCI_O_A]|nr:hypothetical protein [Microcoleus sp. PH2017_04_SCI_O_A]